jgi:uroporphyrinogen decarboxylase
MERLHIDILDIRGVADPDYKGPIPKEIVQNDVKQNYWGMRTKTMQTVTGPEENYCDFILSPMQTVEELEQHPWPQVDWFDFTDFSKKLDEWKDFAIMASGASIWQHPSFLRGVDNLLMDLMMNQDVGHYLIDKFTNFYLKYFDKMFTAAKGKIDMFRIADDLGMQSGLLIGPDMFKQTFAPRFKKLIDMAHSHSIKVMFHSCGSIIPLVNELINIGVDVLDPIQVSASNMNPADIKKLFGNQLCLHGAIDTQYVLPLKKPGEVGENVKQMIDTLGKDGGYIMSPCHVLQTDVPTVNIVSMYDTATQYGKY